MIAQILSRIYSHTGLFFIYSLLVSHLLFSQWLAVDPDLFARMAMGKLIIQQGAFPLQDIFAWTPRLEKWIDHEWLSGVLFYLVYLAGGEWLLYLFKILIAALTVTGLRACFKIQSEFEGAACCSLGLAFFGSAFLWFGTVRCQVFTYLFLVFTYYAIVRHRADSRRWPLVVTCFLMPFWTNLHGGFVLGLIAHGFYASVRLCGKERDLFPALVLVVAVTTTLINPYGFEYWDFIFHALSKPRPQISEWSSVSPFSLRGLVLTSFALVITLSQIKNRPKKFGESWLIVLFSFYSGFRHARLIPLGLFSTIAFFPEAFNLIGQKADRVIRELLLDKILAVLALIILVPSLWSFTYLLAAKSEFKLDYSRYPVDAVAWAQSNLTSGKVLNPFDEGSYILWAAYPHLLVSMDGRYEEVYPEDTFKINAQIFARETLNRSELIKDLAADYIFCPLTKGIATESFGNEWSVVYRDDRWAILKRSHVK